MFGNFIFKQVKKYRFNSLVFKNFIKVFIAIALCLIVLSVFLYEATIKAKYAKIESSCMSDLKNYASVSDALLYDSKTKIFEFLIDQQIMTFLYSDSPLTVFPVLSREIHEMMNTYVDTNRYIYSVCVYSEKSGVICDSEYSIGAEVLDTDWKTIYENMEGQFEIALRLYEGRYPYVLTMIQKTDVVGPKGAIVVNLDVEMLNRSIGYNKDSKKIYITTDKKKNILNSTNENFDYQELNELKGNSLTVSKNGNFVTGVSSEYFDINYYGVFDGNVHLKDILTTKILFVLLNILFIICSIIAALLSSFETYKPLKRIMGILDLNEEIDVADGKGNEVDYVAAQISNLLASNKELKNKVNDHIELSNKMYMSLLSSQINTHFINNTINIINSQIVADVGAGHKSSALLIKLSKLLRNIYNIEKACVSVEEEIKFTKMYVSLLQARYPDMFEVIWNVDENIIDYQIPKMTLQPLIENAIYHGIIPTERYGQITVSISDNNESFVISVRDNGCGINKEEVKKLNEEIIAFDNEKNIGTRNIYKRFNIIYGEKFNALYESEEGVYTEVRLIVSY